LAARQRSQMHAEQYEPEPEPEPEEEQEQEAHEPVHEESSHQEEINAASAAGGKTAVVLFDYEAQEENEISLAEGQVITDVEIIDEVHYLTSLLIIGMVVRTGSSRQCRPIPLQLRRTSGTRASRSPRSSPFNCPSHGSRDRT
jgi:hypothetical protein